MAILAGELAEQLRKTGVRLAEEEAQVKALEQELSDVVQSLSMGLAILGAMVGCDPPIVLLLISFQRSERRWPRR